MTIIDKLLVVQEHDCRARQIEQELQDIPARKDQERTRLQEHTQALSNAQEALKAKHAEVKELELEVDSAKEKINKLRQQQLDLKTNKEFQAIEAEVKAIRETIVSLEDRELSLMEEVDAASRAVSEKVASLKEEELAVEDDTKILDQRASELDGELQKEQSARAEAASGMDPEWLQRYDAIMKHKDRAVVPVEDGVCGGCHMKLPPYIVHNSKKHNEMVTCDFCARLVY